MSNSIKEQAVNCLHAITNAQNALKGQLSNLTDEHTSAELREMLRNASQQLQEAGIEAAKCYSRMCISQAEVSAVKHRELLKELERS